MGNGIILQKIRSTEKIVKQIEVENTLVFETDRSFKKIEIKKEIENLLNVKVAKIRTLTRGNKKFVYAKLKPEFSASDVATKLGLM